MASVSANVHSMLRAAFHPLELDFLRGQQAFTDSIAAAETGPDFQRLCDLGDRLLEENETKPATLPPFFPAFSPRI
jgi:hypothetical protein